jgi:predicted nucleotide-binding protein
MLEIRVKKLQSIKELKQDLERLVYGDEARLDRLRRRTEMVIRNIHGTDSKYLTDLAHIVFHTRMVRSTEDDKRRSWNSGSARLGNLLDTMAEEILVFNSSAAVAMPIGSGGDDELSTRVFVVHGHDDAMKHAVARTLTALRLDPVILHEQPNRGRTVIEKFSDFANVSFAVVLLSPDDTARPRTSPPEDAKLRARQNVILELGYFLGKLGRERVVALYREAKDFEMPSDYSGVLFVPFDANGRWQFDLARELRAVGYSVDLNHLA